MRKFAIILAVAFCLVAPGNVLAYTTFTFDLTIPNAAISGYPGPYVQVNVTETSPTTADFSIFSLQQGNDFYLLGDTNAFAANFNLGGGSVSISNVHTTGWNLPASFVATQTGNNVDGFGVFNTSLKFFDGYNMAFKELIFTATLTGSTWSESMDVLAPNSDGALAAGHVFVQNTNSPFCGALATGFAADGKVPIPATSLLLGSGLLGLVCIGIKRRTLAHRN